MQRKGGGSSVFLPLLGAATPIGVLPLSAATGGRDVSGHGNHMMDYGMMFGEGPDGKPDTSLKLEPHHYYFIKVNRRGPSVDFRRSFTVTLFIYPMNLNGIYLFDWRGVCGWNGNFIAASKEVGGFTDMLHTLLKSVIRLLQL